MIEQNETTSSAALIAAVLAWWAEHECDTVSADAGDGYCEEYNVYDAPPPFVQVAQALAESSGLAQPVEAVDEVERVARAMWTIRREDEDRCDMELEDMPRDHSVWAEARAAIAALAHPRPTGDLRPLDTLDWNVVCSAANQRAEATDSKAAAKLRSSLRSIITAGLSAAGYAPTGEQAGEVVGWTAADELISSICELTVADPDHPDTVCVNVESLRVEVERALAQPRPMGVPDGLADADNPWRRAVEHAGYLVTAVADYMEASSNAGIAIEQVEGIEDPSDEQLEEMHSAQEDADEARSRMRDLCYEFTKRRDRALATLAAAPAPGKGGEA